MQQQGLEFDNIVHLLNNSMSNVIVRQKYDQWYTFETQLDIPSLSVAASWPVGRDKSYGHTSVLTETIAALLWHTQKS